jgi:tetratricopeptide (TPR) repeat protein
VCLGLFSNAGFFGANLFTGKRAEAEAKLGAARKLLGEDTLASYRRAALELHPLVEADPKLWEAAAVEAEARLGAVRLGVSSETKAADKLLTINDEHAGELPETQKALALRALVAGRLPDARAKLGALLAKAPSDATALVYLGWTELTAGDPVAADRAFGKALAAEPGRAAALYGQGVAKERQGDLAPAENALTRALARSPNHFGAAVALVRVQARLKPEAADATPPDARIRELIDRRSSQVGPKEVADAWATLGELAAAAGRREEAEDRFKRALALDPDAPSARVALARVQCDLGRPADSLAALRRLVAAQQKNLEARLVLVRALVESKGEGGLTEAAAALAPAAATKDARVSYWQGRIALAQDKPDREAALARFKEAVAADPKLISAYLAQSSALAQLGRGDEALEPLKQAAARAAGDPLLLTELGEAYLALGKPSEAEAQFRAVVEQHPDAHSARVDLGLALELQGKLADAEAAYHAVADKAPKFPGLSERLARLAVKEGKKDEAAKLFAQALADGVPTPGLRLAAGELALEQGRLDDARKLAEAVIKEDDRSSPAHLLLARALLDGNHPEDALPEARRAATFSDLPEAHLVLGRVLESLGKLDQAVVEYQQARRAPVEAEATLGRARILVRMGATRDALAELNVLVKDNRLRAPALVLIGDCYSDLQQADKARHAYEDAVKHGPQLGEAAFKLARALHDAGRRKPAIDMFQRALKLGGDHAPYAAEASLLLGDAHREGRENDAAVQAYRRYLELAPSDAPARTEVSRQISLLGGR